MRLKIAIDEIRGSMDKMEADNGQLKRRIDEYIQAEIRHKHVVKTIKKNTSKFKEISLMQLEEIHALKAM
jgi:hypothetical protein